MEEELDIGHCCSSVFQGSLKALKGGIPRQKAYTESYQEYWCYYENLEFHRGNIFHHYAFDKPRQHASLWNTYGSLLK